MIAKASKQWLLAILFSVALAGCSILPEKEEQRQQAEPIQPAEPVVSPVSTPSKAYYGGILPYAPNQSRGTLKKLDSRIDITHLEWGLLELAGTAFSPDQYLFQEGQMVTRKEIDAWLKGNEALEHVLEHDYLDKDTKKIAGATIALTFNPRYKDPSGKIAVYTDEELTLKGQNAAQAVIQAIRKKEASIPLRLAIFRTESQSSLIPGRFIASARVEEGQTAASDWKPIHERFYLLPGEGDKDIDAMIPAQFDKFQKDIKQFFPEYVGVTGLAHVKDNKLVELTLTAHAEYDSYTEVIQFIQYAASLLPEYFDRQVHINLYVETIDKPLAIYIRPTEGDPIFHVYHK